MMLASLLLVSASFAYGQDASPTCLLTTRDQEGPYFIADAPTSRVIAPEDEMTPDNAVVLTGRILDRSCNPVTDAMVEVWYAGGPNGKFRE